MTVNLAVPYKGVYQFYAIMSMMCEGTHFSIFPPLSGALYGPVLQVPVNALFFIAFGFASTFGVFLFGSIVPILGWTILFYILGGMTCISLFINWKVQYTFETKMPFVTKS